MVKISTASTFVSKKLLPLVWFGFLVLFIVVATTSGSFREHPWMLLAPCAVVAFGFLVMKKRVFDLVDEVYDCGDSLLVRNRGEEERVALANIMNVNASMNMNPPRITLRLVEPGKFGGEIAFSPIGGFSFNPLARNKIAEDLIDRVHRARSTRA